MLKDLINSSGLGIYFFLVAAAIFLVLGIVLMKAKFNQAKQFSAISIFLAIVCFIIGMIAPPQ